MAYNPPTVIFSSSRKAAGWQDKRKDTLQNVEETGEYVVNVVVDDIAAAMNATAAEYPSDVSEFDIAGSDGSAQRNRQGSSGFGITREHGVPPDAGGRISVSFPHSHGLVVGEIVRMHVRDDILYEGPNGLRINHEALRPTGRLAGNMYCHTDDVYELVRPHYTPQPAEQAAD